MDERWLTVHIESDWRDNGGAGPTIIHAVQVVDGHPREVLVSYDRYNGSDHHPLRSRALELMPAERFFPVPRLVAGVDRR